MTDDARDLPEGTVTFVFTDIEGSTRMAADQPEGFRKAIADHNEILRATLESHRGREVRTEGDSFFAVFRSAPEAVGFAAETQRTLAAHSWPVHCEVRVRMGIHTGTAAVAEHERDDYVGLHVHRAARIESAAHGGQVLVSESTRAVVESDLSGLGFRDLGEYQLKDLDQPEHLYQLVVPGLPDEFPAIRSLDRVPNNLTEGLTSFVGRETVLRDAVKALETARLVTLTGPGGTGKTRLSLQIGRDRLSDFPDGVYFVDLASLEDAGLVASEVLGAMRVHPPSGAMPEDYVLHYLSHRRLLLILDNFEQILAAAPFTSDMLRAAPDVKIVVTSRAALHVSGEREIPVPPLGLPDPRDASGPEALLSSEAVRLFVDRAVAVRPDFTVDHDNAGAVSSLVSRLDGLPLAIELAAARVKAFPVAIILDRIAKGMLEGSARDLPERQRTISGAIAWSYDMLSGPCRRLFERFSIFAGGAGINQIERVCGPADDLGGDLFDALTELVDQSLVVPPGSSNDVRYRMLVTIRDFARARLDGRGESAEMQRRHLETYLELTEAAAPQLVTAEQVRWLDRLDADHDNIRAALAWAVSSGDVDAAHRLVASVWRFWQIRGHLIEAISKIDEVLALEGADPESRLAALEAAGGVAYWRGSPRFVDHYREAVEIARRLSDRLRLANALYNASFGAARGHDREEGVAALEEARSIYEGLGDQIGVARVDWGAGNIASAKGDHEAALEFFDRSVQGFKGMDRPFDLGWALFGLSFTKLMSGRFDDAEDSIRDSFRIFIDAGDMSAIVLHLAAMAASALSEGDSDRAYRLAGAAARLKDETGSGLVDSPENQYAGLAPEDLESLEGHDAVLLVEGRALSTERAIAYALREIDVGGDSG